LIEESYVALQFAFILDYHYIHDKMGWELVISVVSLQRELVSSYQFLTNHEQAQTLPTFYRVLGQTVLGVS